MTSRQVATDVPVTGSANRAQACDEMSINLLDSVGRKAEKGMFDHFPQKLDNRYTIERLKALKAMTFTETTNPTDAEKWLSLIDKCFGVMDGREKRKVKLVTFLLQDKAEDLWILHVTRAGREDLIV